VVVVCGAIVALGVAMPAILEASGVVNSERDRVLGEVPITLPLIALGAIFVVGFFVLLGLIVACLIRRASRLAAVLAVVLAFAVVLDVAVHAAVCSMATGSRGFAAWTKSVNTAPVTAWLATNPTGPPPPASEWLLYYAGEKSALNRSACVPVNLVPRFDTGRLPEEVFLLPGNGAIFAVYRANLRIYFVVIGPAAASVPAEFEAPVTWTTVRPDFLVGEFTRG
jgi:hypothetical protein